jgi:hypothetical protein
MVSPRRGHDDYDISGIGIGGTSSTGAWPCSPLGIMPFAGSVILTIGDLDEGIGSAFWVSGHCAGRF